MTSVLRRPCEPERDLLVTGTRPRPLGEAALAIGPLKIERFLRAKTDKPGELGPAAGPPKADLASLNAGKAPRFEGRGLRETRIPEGNVGFVGVAGNILTELCGDFPPRRDPEAVLSPDGLARLALDVDEALECVCLCPDTDGYALRIEETDELVLFLPLNPDERR